MYSQLKPQQIKASESFDKLLVVGLTEPILKLDSFIYLTVNQIADTFFALPRWWENNLMIICM